MSPSTRSTRTRPYQERSKTAISPLPGMKAGTARESGAATPPRSAARWGRTRTWRGSSLGRQALDGPALAGGVEALEEHQQGGPDLVGREQPGGEEPQLREPVLRVRCASPIRRATGST